MYLSCITYLQCRDCIASHIVDGSVIVMEYVSTRYFGLGFIIPHYNLVTIGYWRVGTKAQGEAEHDVLEEAEFVERAIIGD